jgi:hypothetical protein
VTGINISSAEQGTVLRAASTAILCNLTCTDHQDDSVVGKITIQRQVACDQENTRASAGRRKGGGPLTTLITGELLVPFNTGERP